METRFARTLSDGRAGLAALVAAIEAFLEQAAVPEAVVVNLDVKAVEKPETVRWVDSLHK